MALKIGQLGGVQAASDSGAPTDGTSGTGAGLLEPGSQYTNEANGKVYVNTGTKASPTWTIVGTQS